MIPSGASLTQSRGLARRRFLAGGGIVLLAFTAASLFPVRVSGKMPDFEVYWHAGARAAAAAPLYRAEDGHYQFKYLPAFAIVMAPLSRLDLANAKIVWFATSLALLGLLLALSLRLLPARRRPPWLLVCAAVGVLGKFYAHELVLGQVNLLFAVIVVAGLMALQRGRETLGGSVLASSIVLKPYGVLFLPWVVARGRVSATVSSITAVAVALVLPVPLYGIAGTVALHEAWWQTVVSTTAPNLLNPDNVSWLAMYTRWAGPGTLAAACTLLTAGCAVAAGLWTWIARRAVPCPEGLEGALLLAAIPFLSPQGWDYVLLGATPAVMYLVNYSGELPAGVRWLTFLALATIGLTIFDLMGRTAYHWFMSMSGITLAFLVVIAALVTLRARRAA